MDKVKVYFNLHKKCWSIKSMDTGADYGKVKDHALMVELWDVVPKVSQAGRERVLREQKKNVHAGLTGKLHCFAKHEGSFKYVYRYLINNKRANPVWREITYNPYKHESFVYVDTGKPFTGADQVYLLNKRVYAR